jgi:hypothetical protein
LKLSKFGVITLLLFGMVIALAGIAYADQPVPATPETQTLGTVTIADVEGIAMETDAGTWTLTNGGTSMYIATTTGDPIVSLFLGADDVQQLLAAGGSVTFETIGGHDYLIQISVPAPLLSQNMVGHPVSWQYYIDDLVNNEGYALNIASGGIHTGALYPNQVQYTTAYDANIVAQAGHTSFVKSMNIDTRNKIIGQSNIKADTALTFIATADGGNVVGSENIMLDGAGNATTAADKMLCPFASAGGNVIPAYCNIIQAGSKYDLTVGSVTTSANDKFVGSDATIPVVLNYAINVKPYTASGTQVPAIGSAMAYIKAHIQEGNNFNTTKAEDLTYSETSSANGYIYSFNKVIAYQSGKSLL